MRWTLILVAVALAGCATPPPTGSTPPTQEAAPKPPGPPRPPELTAEEREERARSWRGRFGDEWRSHPEGRAAGLRKRCTEFFRTDYGPIVARFLGGSRNVVQSATDFVSVLDPCTPYIPLLAGSVHDLNGRPLDRSRARSENQLPETVEELRRMLLLSELYDACSFRGRQYPLSPDRVTELKLKIARLRGMP